MVIKILNFSLYSTLNGPVTLGNLLEFVLILSVSIIISRVIILYLRRYFGDKVSKNVVETTIKLIYYVPLIIISITIFPLIGLDPSGLLLAGGDYRYCSWFCKSEYCGEFDFWCLPDDRKTNKNRRSSRN